MTTICPGSSNLVCNMDYWFVHHCEIAGFLTGYGLPQAATRLQ